MGGGQLTTQGSFKINAAVTRGQRPEQERASANLARDQVSPLVAGDNFGNRDTVEQIEDPLVSNISEVLLDLNGEFFEGELGVQILHSVMDVPVSDSPR